jgi:hypothetical protein
MRASLILGGVLLGVVAGVGGYHLLARCAAGAKEVAAGPAAAPAAPAARDAAAAAGAVGAAQGDGSEVRRHLAIIESRLARLEARPGFEEALNDPAMRDRLAAVVTEARNAYLAPPRSAPTVPEPWRETAVNRYRNDYARVLDAARKQMQLDEAAWKEVKPVFDRHFAPVDAALKELAAGRGSSTPKVNELVAPGLQATLEALKRSLSPEAWLAFDAWRKAEEAVPFWSSASKGECFLDGEDYRSYRRARTVQTHWATLQGMLPGLRAKLDLDPQKRERLDAALKAHVARICAAFGDEARITLMTDAGQAKAKAAMAETEPELARILGPEGMQRFRDWTTAPANYAGPYFGERIRPALQGATPSAFGAAPPASAQRPVASGPSGEKF